MSKVGKIHLFVVVLMSLAFSLAEAGHGGGGTVITSAKPIATHFF